MEKAEEIMEKAKRHPFIPRLASVLLALFALAQPANAQDEPVGQLAYIGSGGDGDFDIYVSDASGDGFVDLSRNDVWDSGAVFSPDGRRIAFWTDRHGDRSVPLGYRNVEIYVMDADGSNVRRLTHHEAGMPTRRGPMTGAASLSKAGGTTSVTSTSWRLPTEVGSST